MVHRINLSIKLLDQKREIFANVILIHDILQTEFNFIILFYLVMGRDSKFWARAEPKPEAWGLSLGLTHPYRWVEPAKTVLKLPIQVSSPSRAWAEPQASPTNIN